MSSQLAKRILSSIVLIPIVLSTFWVGGIVLAAFILALFILAYAEWLKISVWEGKRQTWLSVFGFFYCAAGILSLFDISSQTPHLWLPLCVFISVWMSDSCAYLMGKIFGGAKMAPKISPNKTWSGMAGACLGPAIGMFIFQIMYDSSAGYEHNIADITYVFLALGYGFIVGIAGQIGDLTISFMKRKAQLKDTGKLIPGHGGILDRIDALLLVCIFFWCWMQLGGYSLLFHMSEEWSPLWSRL